MSGGDGETIGRRTRINRRGRRERKMQRFKSSGSAQKFPVEPCSRLHTFNGPTPSHLGSDTPTLRAAAMKTWREAAVPM